jgi:phosphoserine phosphatase
VSRIDEGARRHALSRTDVKKLADTPPPYAAVIFDCDSTLSAIEGIDELARLHSIDVREMTRRAMQGEIALEDVYKLRLEHIRPTRDDVEAIGRLYVERMLPHARELVSALRHLAKHAWVVSGGLEPAVAMLARAAGFDGQHVLAVAIRHGARGEYVAFDERSPLAKSGGKIEVLRSIARRTDGAVALVGDGVTDLEAVEEAGARSRFIAFGGVERRAAVFARSLVTCERADLAALVPLLFSQVEIDKLAGTREHAELVRAARELA